MNAPKLPGKPEMNPRVSGDCGWISATQFDEWYAELQAWHKQVFEGAVEVFSMSEDAGISCEWVRCERILSDNARNALKTKALLINITPIKEETAEDLLKEIIQ